MSEKGQDTLWAADGQPLDSPSVKRAFGRLVDPLTKVMEATRRGVPPEKLESSLRAIPDDLGAQITAARDATLQQLAVDRAARTEAFGRWLVDFVQGCRRDGIPVRETQHWRVGRVELEPRRDTAQARIRYDDETVVDWTSVGSPDDLREMYQRAEAMLDGRALPDDALVEGLWSAYRRLLSADPRAGSRVLIRDLHRELRVELFRRELRTRPDRTINPTEMPTWAFRFNLDRYRDLGPRVPPTQRLLFETGSQDETRRFGVRLNGLRADEDHRSFCFVRAPSTQL